MAKVDAEAFLKIKSLNELAIYLDIPLNRLTFFAFSKKVFYTSFSIPKRDAKENRTISTPVAPLKAIQRSIANTLQSIYQS
ncbi:MAG TPA: hypothetical protein K8U77_01640, partial [Slackia equolifaciens]|nr:hypothetical protein [Slackia equolifaciens]